MIDDTYATLALQNSGFPFLFQYRSLYRRTQFGPQRECDG